LCLNDKPNHTSARRADQATTKKPEKSGTNSDTENKHVLQVGNNQDFEVEGFLRRKFEGLIKEIEPVEREDLDLVRL
jgi:hypothetical protein